MKQALAETSVSNPQEHIEKCEAWIKKKPHEANINYEQMLIWVGYDFKNPSVRTSCSILIHNQEIVIFNIKCTSWGLCSHQINKLL
jgi:hypothetical protein